MFVNRVYRHARENPGKLAVVNSGQEITYGRFALDIEAARNHLMRAGLPGDGVIVRITGNLYLDWVLLLSTRSLGMTTVAGTSWQVIESLGMTNITGLVCISGEDRATDAFRASRPDCAIAEVPQRMLFGSRKDSPPLPVPDGHFGDHIVYTSGTTGVYKKLLQPGDRIQALLECEAETIAGSYSPDDVYHLHSFGPWSAAGYRICLGCWGAGAAVVFEQRTDPLKHFFDHPITDSFFVPDLLKQVRPESGRRGGEDRELTLLVGGGFLDARLARKIRTQFGCRLLMAYGGTEFRTPLENFVETDDDLVWLTLNRNAGFEVVDDNNREVDPGVTGIVRMKLRDFLPTEYLDDPEATAKHFRNGYFYPGDMAIRRKDGRIRIVGRVDDVLNLSGQKIAIEPFEDAARKVLGVERLCAFVLQDDSGKDELVMAIEGSELPARDRLEDLKTKLPQVQRVRFSLVDTFPRGENGMMKINRKKVLELVRDS